MDRETIQARTLMLLGREALERLSQTKVAVFGLGGVGSACCEALARGGIGHLLLIDNDTVSPSNLNRQLVATVDRIGEKKTEAMAARIHSVAPFTETRSFDLFVLPDNIKQVDLTYVDYVVDAVDTVAAKLAILETCHSAGIPAISCMGTGNRLDPTRFRICDIFETSGDGLARVMRHELRKRGIASQAVLFSDETPLKTAVRTPGSVSFVPPVAGMIIASYVIRQLIGTYTQDNEKTT